jgi:hypothetical protein
MQARKLLMVATLVCGAVLLTSERAQASEGEANCYYHAHTPHEWVHICANLERGLRDTVRGLGRVYSNSERVHVQVEDVILWGWGPAGHEWVQAATCKGPGFCPQNSQEGAGQPATSSTGWTECAFYDLWRAEVLASVRWSDGTLTKYTERYSHEYPCL